MKNKSATLAVLALVGSVALIGCGSSSKSSSSVDCGNIFSTDPSISTKGFVALQDDQHLVPNEAVLPLITKDKATPEVTAVLDGISAKLDTPELTKLVAEAITDKKAPDVVAKEFVDTLPAPAKAAAPMTIVVGSANFAENQILAEIYGQQLARAGFTIDKKPAIGNREVYYKAISATPAEIDLVPEYTNSVLSYVVHLKDPSASPTATNVDEQVAELKSVLPPTLTVLTPSTAEDKDVIVCTKAVADKYKLTNLTDLAKVADQITIAGPPEFETRTPFGIAGFKAKLGATFKKFVPLQIGDIPAALSK
ncbi:MAG: glycine betaine ABC transporter substrate-binding protein [Ilumatobacteraceae bacterium]